ncbi:MAG: glycosyltransferase family 4 protein [Deltaproteobacteria bacterium]|nr:MAG: glycosyltransferase family 4 protein [Deltaproteobacteria bacterium]
MRPGSSGGGAQRTRYGAFRRAGQAAAAAVIGNLWRVKGHRTLVEAAAEIAARIPRVKFLCAGEGPEREALEKRIAELGLEKTVHLLGHRLDIPAILARSRAACLCSSAEGLSNALMEAMASSLPIVATSVGGNPELVRPGENGLLVPFGDARALSTALVQLLSDPAAAAEMGRRGRLRIESELTLEKMAEGHGALYRRALDASAVRAAA